MYVCACIMLFLMCNAGYAQGEAFSATANLIHLLESERERIPSLEAYIKSEENRLAEIRRYVEKTRDRDIINADESLLYVGHPINAYHLIKRLSRLAINTQNNSDITENVTGSSLLTEADFTGACAAILRLQRTFSLRTDDVAEGRILNVSALESLSLDDSVRIGKVALQIKDYGLAAEWIEKALTPDEYNVTSQSELYKDLFKAYKGMENIPKAIEYGRKTLELGNEDTELEEEYNQMSLELKEVAVDQEWKNSSTWERKLPEWKSSYERLCRGENDALKDPKHTRDLMCRYKPGKIQWVVYKEEILSWDPRISMFYDVISDSQGEMIKTKAYLKLKRGKVMNSKERYSTPARVSKVAWLWDTDTDVKALSQRVQDITGLQTTHRTVLSSAEAFQVVNYGIGGQYEPHVDYFKTKEVFDIGVDCLKNTGNRVSTFLFYLSDVEYGGATVFTQANIRVPPIKNGAAFWYNLKLSGDLDEHTQHAGCPVLLGQKWVVNKWIREYGQEFRRPCALDQNAIDLS